VNTGTNAPVRALTVAGSDPSGGAGIQADLKTFAAFGAYGMAALTSLTAQNTRGVTAVHVPPPEFLTAQLRALADDVAIDAVKIGMVADGAVAEALAAWLAEHRPPVVVLDPVMVATSGDRLLDPGAVSVVRDRLIPLAHLVTPNVPEVADLLGRPVAADWARAIAQAEELRDRTGTAVLLKGGHLGGDHSPDALLEPGRPTMVIDAERVPTKHTHGTGCTLSAGLAAVRPRTDGWGQAVALVKPWLSGALRAADRLEVGTGAGPLHHFHASWDDAWLIGSGRGASE
jgi:hydroxymethylpyrimidine/phosphomethylpyrimidine kinase